MLEQSLQQPKKTISAIIDLMQKIKKDRGDNGMRVSEVVEILESLKQKLFEGNKQEINDE